MPIDNYMNFGNIKWEREQEGRRKVQVAALKNAAYHYDHPGAVDSELASEFDAAVIELAAALNEPDRCVTCGAEIKQGEAHP